MKKKKKMRTMEKMVYMQRRYRQGGKETFAKGGPKKGSI